MPVPKPACEMNMTPMIDVRYGDVVTLIDAAKGAGVQRVGIITDRLRAKS